MDFEIRCDSCNAVFRTEKDKDFDSAIKIAVWFGNTTSCDKCGHVGISAYAGNRVQNIWHKIEEG